MTVWTEIYSIIEGTNAGSWYATELSEKQYTKTYASKFLSRNQVYLVYWIYLQYKSWKIQQNAYDFMDVVSYVSRRLRYGYETLSYRKLDYLMIDEVQDLTPKTIELLLTITKHKIFFAGDTAQTIAKGVSSRFIDLRHTFSQFDGLVPKVV